MTQQEEMFFKRFHKEKLLYIPFGTFYKELEVAYA
jgi:hypothetical protein